MLAACPPPLCVLPAVSGISIVIVILNQTFRHVLSSGCLLGITRTVPSCNISMAAAVVPKRRPGMMALAHLQGAHARPAPVAPVGDAAGRLQVLRHQRVPQRVEERAPQRAVPDAHQVKQPLHPCGGSRLVYQGGCMASTQAQRPLMASPDAFPGLRSMLCHKGGPQRMFRHLTSSGS